MLRSIAVIATAAGALAASALAGPITFTIDPAQSQIAVTMSATGASDTDSSAVTGTIELCLNDPAHPTIVSVQDMSAALSSQLHFLLNYGLLGTITADSTNAAAAYGTPGAPTGPAVVDGAGAFVFADPQAVPVVLSGAMSVVSTGVISGAIPSQTVNLADFGAAPAEFTATLASNGAAITVSGSVAFSQQTDLGVLAEGTLTIVATAPLPTGGCVCDFDCAPGIDVFDLLAYLDEWFAGSAAAEMTADAPPSVDVFDLLAFLDCWFAGSAGAC